MSWLIHAGIGGSVFFAVGCLAVRFCRQPVRRIRLIELTLGGALLLPCASALPWLPHWSTGWISADAPAAVVTTGTESTTSSADDARQNFPNPDAALDSLASDKEAPARRPGPQAALDASLSVQPAPVAQAAAMPHISVISVVLMGYAVAVSYLLLRLLIGLYRVLWLWRASYQAPEPIPGLLRAIAGEAAGSVVLRASERIESPLMFTAGRPVILLPARLCQQGDEAGLRFCLAHEWSHVECRDARRWYLSELVCFLFFWHPLFWWLRRQLRLCQDYLADARASAQADSEEYAGFLLTLARRHMHEPALTLGIRGGHSDLYWRIRMLLQTRQNLERRCLTVWSGGAGLIALALFIGVAAVRLDAGAASAGDNPAPAVPPMAQPDKPAEKAEALHYSGKVTDKDTGKAVAGAVVVVRRSLLNDPAEKEPNRIIQETKHTTDGAGKYSFVIPPEQVAKRYLYIELDVEHPDYAARKHFGYALSMILKNEKLGGRAFFENVELRAGKPITGIVRTVDGKPVPGVKVLAYSVTTAKSPDTFEYGSFVDCRTDAAGKFRLVLTTPGQAVFWILPEAYVPSIHGVPLNKRGDLGSFTLEDGVRIKGKVLDTKGNPVAGVNVNAERTDRSEELAGLAVADSIRRSAVTDSKGEFSLMPLPPGAYRLKPDEYPQEPSSDLHVHRPVPEVFLPQRVTLKAGEAPQTFELRAVPSVIIEAQHYDSKGNPTRGHAPHLFGRIDKEFWHTQGQMDANGKVVMRVPHGLEQAKMQLMTNEHGSLRWRKTKDAPLSNGREIDLGTLNDDVKGIEIIRYVAPILLVKVKASDDSKPKDIRVTASYGEGKKRDAGKFIVGGGLTSDVLFERQEDARFRSEGLLPDEEITLIAYADGYTSAPVSLKIAEKESKEIELVLEKATAKKPKE
jgi:beta-lactamase regulating signal transducer with metallopeptidase domain